MLSDGCKFQGQPSSEYVAAALLPNQHVFGFIDFSGNVTAAACRFATLFLRRNTLSECTCWGTNNPGKTLSTLQAVPLHNLTCSIRSRLDYQKFIVSWVQLNIWTKTFF